MDEKKKKDCVMKLMLDFPIHHINYIGDLSKSQSLHDRRHPALKTRRGL